MADKVSNVLLRYKTDKASLQETSSLAQRLKQQLGDYSEQLADDTQVLVDKYIALARAEGDVEKRAKELNQELKKIGAGESAIALATKEFDDMTDSIRQAEAESKRLQDQFDRISQQVSFGGDIQSNLGAVQGLAGTLGGSVGGRAGQGIAVAGEIAALTEELPRLKAAIQGAPQLISTLISTIGVGGIAGAATLIGGFVVLNEVLRVQNQIRQRNIELTRQQSQSLLDVNETLAQVLAQGTPEAIEEAVTSAQQRLRELELENDLIAPFLALREELNRSRAESEQGVERFANATDEYFEASERLAEIQERFGIEFADTGEAFRVLTDRAVTNNREIETLNSTLNELNNVTAETVVNEAELTQARLTNARAEADALQEIIELNALDVDGLESRRDALLNNSAVLGAELNALRATGDTSEEVTNRINELTDALVHNGEIVNRIDSLLLPSARAQEALAKAEEERLAVEENLINATQSYNADVERALQERADIEEKYHDNLIKIAETAVKASEDALDKLEQKQADLLSQLAQGNVQEGIELERDNLQAQVDAQRQERDELRDHLRKLQDIKDKAQDSEFEPILNRDFRQLFTLRRGTTRDLNNENQQFTDRRNDAIQALQDERQDRLNAYEQDRVDRFNAYQQQNALAQAQYQQELQAIEDRRRQAVTDAQATLIEQQDALQRQLTLRRQAWVQEIQLAQQGTQAMINIENQRQQALLAQAQAGLQAIRAQGNAIAQLGSQTGFNFAGVSNITNSRTNNNNITNNINGNNTQQMTDIVYRVISGFIR